MRSFWPSLVVAFAASACLLPDYAYVGGGQGGEAAVSSASSGGSVGSGGAGGQIMCPPDQADYVARFGSDIDKVVVADFARAADGTSALIGLFYNGLTYKSGMSISSDDATNGNGFIVGMDAKGSGQWAVPVTGSGTKTMTAIAPTNDGWIVAGSSDKQFGVGQLDGFPFTGGTHGFVAKVSDVGDVEWLDQLEVINGAMATPLGIAVDPSTGIFVVGQAGGTLKIERKPTPIPNNQQLPVPNPSPMLVHLSPMGDLVTVQVWPSSNHGSAQSILLSRDGMMRWVFGSYLGSFPNAQLQNQPPSASSYDAFILRLDNMDTPQGAIAAGDPERIDLAMGGAELADGNLVVAVETDDATTGTMGFEFAGTTIPMAALTADFDLVIAGVDPMLTRASWAKLWAPSANTPAPTQRRFTLREDRALLSIALNAGSATYDTHVFMANDADSVLLDVDPMTGNLHGSYSLGGPGYQAAFLASSPCDDTIVGTFQGAITLQQQCFSPQTQNALISSTKNRLMFTSP